MSKGSPPPLRAFHPIISARQASFGATLFIGGMFLQSSGHRWWIDRCRASLRMFDLVRLDHFRGFEAYWEVPANASTAAEGKWVKGQVQSFFGFCKLN